jgi:hypothetical protein
MNGRLKYEIEGGIPLRQELGMILITLENTSSRPVRIVSVEPVGATGIPQVVRIKRIELFPRGIGENIHLPNGPYAGYPPVFWDRGQCWIGQTVRPGGHVIRPSGLSTNVAMHFRAVSPGRGGFDAVRVVYETEGESYQQVFPYAVYIRVRKDAPAVEPPGKDERCL